MRLFLLAVMVVCFITGCSEKSGLPPEERRAALDASGIAQAALDQYDKNKNGQIEGAELDACPALKAALLAMDKNKDRSLSASEIKERVERYTVIGEVGLTCMVRLDGQPLAGATITFEPEPFMGTSLKTATTTTDKEGVSGPFESAGKSSAALPAGLYRIHITKSGTNIPARYNTQTTLGQEVMVAPRQGEATIEIALTSR